MISRQLCQQYKELAIISISRYVLLRSLDYVLHIINVSGVLPTLGTYQSVLIRGVASFQGSRLEGVHRITVHYSDLRQHSLHEYISTGHSVLLQSLDYLLGYLTHVINVSGAGEDVSHLEQLSHQIPVGCNCINKMSTQQLQAQHI